MNKNLVAIVLFFAIVFFGCRQEDVLPEAYENGVFVMNEGNFQSGNGSISFISRTGDLPTQNKVFKTANDFLLGDVVQSMIIHNNLGYIVVNNSGKIEIVLPNTMESLGTINGFTSPRYILPISEEKAYVTDLFSGTISIVNLNTKTITGTIAVNGWTENMVFHNDKVYVTNPGNDKVLVINTTNDMITTEINTPKSPNAIVKDKNGMLWITCSGGYQEDVPELIQIDPNTNSISKDFILGTTNDSAGNLVIDDKGEQLFFISNGVQKMKITDLSIPSSPLYTNSNAIIYNLGFDPIGKDLYVNDVIDYVQSGKTYRINSETGELLQTYNVSIIPGGFCFN